VLWRHRLLKLSNRYYFETSLLAEFYFQKSEKIFQCLQFMATRSQAWTMEMRFVYGRRLIVTFFNRVLKEFFIWFQHRFYLYNIWDAFISIWDSLRYYGVDLCSFYKLANSNWNPNDYNVVYHSRFSANFTSH
jgi:hypothetical protein